MAVTSAGVVYAVIWFLTLFCILPFRAPSQAESGEVVPGTPASAPAGNVMRGKFKLTTLIAFVIWVPVCLGIIYGWISADTINLYDRFGPNS
jgi:predicted secreted protein